MNTILFTILCVLALTLLFNVVYFNIVGVYFHTKFRYKLFALRDRLRRLRIDYPDMDDHVYEIMELRLNGSIGLVSFLSIRNIVLTALISSPDRRDKDKVREMNQVITKIYQNQNCGLWWSGIFEIENERAQIWKQIISFNSPYILLTKPVLLFLPLAKSIVSTYNRRKVEVVPVMMIRAAASSTVVVSAIIR